MTTREKLIQTMETYPSAKGYLPRGVSLEEFIALMSVDRPSQKVIDQINHVFDLIALAQGEDADCDVIFCPVCDDLKPVTRHEKSIHCQGCSQELIWRFGDGWMGLGDVWDSLSQYRSF